MLGVVEGRGTLAEAVAYLYQGFNGIDAVFVLECVDTAQAPFNLVKVTRVVAHAHGLLRHGVGNVVNFVDNRLQSLGKSCIIIRNGGGIVDCRQCLAEQVGGVGFVPLERVGGCREDFAEL